MTQHTHPRLDDWSDTEINELKVKCIAEVNRRHRGTTMMPKLGKDIHQPGDKWKFDESVTKVFEDMLERSIPDYQQMRHLVSELVACNLDRDTQSILDIGCSNGLGIAHVLDRISKGSHYWGKIVGLEISEPMRAEASERFASDDRVEIRNVDLRTGLLWQPLDPPLGVALSILTLMFVPIEHRQSLLQKIYDMLEPGGALILVEKILGNTALLDLQMVRVYHAHKLAMGYTEDDVNRKALSLEGVLVPVTAQFNEMLLRSAGFTKIDCFWRWMKFAGWIAIK